MSPSSYVWLVVVLAVFVLVRVTSLDSRYEGCAPRECGGLNISYPFWVVDDDQGANNSVCGYRGFDMRCIDGRPIYRTSRAQYLIKNISYDDGWFRIVDLQALNSSCPKPMQNYSFDRAAVDFSPCHANLILFYGCRKSSPLADFTTLVKVPCDRNTSYVSFVGLFTNGSTPDWPNTTWCETFVSAPVELEESQMNSTIEDKDYAGLLKAGFALRWTGLYDCGRCGRSGGRCGYDHENETSVCFCPDGSHALDCHDVPAGKIWKPDEYPGIAKENTLSSYARLPYFTGGFEGKVIYSNETDRRRHEWHKIGLGVGIGGLAVVLCLLSLGIFFKQCAMKRASCGRSSGIEDHGVYFEVPIFTNRELEEATGRFSPSNELGDGGFGTVYYGKLRDGREVAVKRLFEHNSHRVKHFMNEVEILTRLRHKYLVILYGCTSSRSHDLLLVYEYVPNGTVASHLSGERLQAGRPLTWHIRMSIAIQTAAALTFLHASDIVHRDVKTNNILLDKDFGVKVADFGISRLFPNDVTHVSTAPQGTPGYVDPEYHQCYQLTEKSDVYSFGVVLVELISSKPAVDLSRDKHEINLANFAVNRIQRHALVELIDPALGSGLNPEAHRMMTLVAELAFRCLQLEKEMRPTMEEVLVELQAIASGGNMTNGDKITVMYDGNLNVLPPSPFESENISLLKKMHPTHSPVSVTQKWESCSSTSLSGDTSDKVGLNSPAQLQHK